MNLAALAISHHSSRSNLEYHLATFSKEFHQGFSGEESEAQMTKAVTWGHTGREMQWGLDPAPDTQVFILHTKAYTRTLWKFVSS